MPAVDLGQVVPEISIGTVTTGAAGSQASASISGDTGNVTLNMTIPRGNTGERGATGGIGPAGAKGDPGVSPTFSIENGHLYADYDNPYTPE